MDSEHVSSVELNVRKLSRLILTTLISSLASKFVCNEVPLIKVGENDKGRKKNTSYLVLSFQIPFELFQVVENPPPKKKKINLLESKSQLTNDRMIEVAVS